MSTPPLTIERRTAPVGDVLVVRGEVDLTSVQTLEDAIAGVSAPVLVLDLCELEFLDSAGMRAIDHAHRRFGEEGRALLVVAPRESRAGWTLRVAGFAEDFAHESLEVALLEAGGRGTA